MPSLSALLRNALSGSSQSEPVPQPGSSSNGSSNSSNRASSESHRQPEDTITTHYLSTPLPLQSISPPSGSAPALGNQTGTAIQPIPPPSSQPIPIPPSTLLYTLIHPSPSSSDVTAFFLQCLPDAIGYLHHCTAIITSHLSPRYPAQSRPGPAPKWRFQHLTLHLDPHYSGLAATSSGYIRLSLPWITDIYHQNQHHQRSLADATKEFKGVILHELVHAIQHDGFGSTPGWLIESIADWVRLKAGLGPPHWREPGQGKSAEERGWEEGYDSGARFLDWLVGGGGEMVEGPVGNRGSGWAQHGDDHGQIPFSATTATGAPPAQPTTFNPPPASQPPPPHRDPQQPNKPRRRGPFPSFVRDLDARLERERWSDAWWMEMTGGRLEELWAEYMTYYR